MPGVPRSTYYWMIEHPEAGRVDPIAGGVHAVRRDGHERCGAGKIKAALERRGVTASRRRVGNIMRERGMRARMCFVKFLWAVSAFLLVRLSGCF